MPPSRVPAALRLAFIPAIVVVALLVGWQLGYFDLDRRQELLGVVQRLRVMPGVEIAFVAVFAIAIALCLPANIATLLGGAIFGPWIGALVALGGSLTATVLAYWLARSVARRPIEKLFGKHRLLHELKAHDGVLPLFRLRVMPIAPFAVLAYLAGIAGVSMRRLLAATLLGGIPTSVAYAFVGAALLEGLVSTSDASKRAWWIAGGVTLIMLLVSITPGIVRRLRD